MAGHLLVDEPRRSFEQGDAARELPSAAEVSCPPRHALAELDQAGRSTADGALAPALGHDR